MLFCPFLEAREAFIKQFSLLEASTGRLLAQLHGITSALDCSLNATETNERNESRADGGSGVAVCQPLAQTVSVIRGSQRRLQQATLDLDNMVGHDLTTAWFSSQREPNLLKVCKRSTRSIYIKSQERMNYACFVTRNSCIPILIPISLSLNIL